jgi:hypothetical protein
MALLNKQNVKFNTSLEAPLTYPANELDEIAPLTVDNIYVKDRTLFFDLDLEDISLRDFDAIRIVPLNQVEIETLQDNNFPLELTQETKKILFGDSRDVSTYQVKPSIEGIQVNVGDLEEELFTILIVLEDTPDENSDVYTLEVNADVVGITKSENTIDYKDVFTSKFTDTTNLEIIENKSFISNLYFSPNSEKVVTGVFCLDKKRLVEHYAKFPTLIEIDDNQLFDSFFFKSNMFVYRYEEEENGYNFNDDPVEVVAEPINDLLVENFSRYRFYQFDFGYSRESSKFQVVANMHFDDPTINLAKNKLTDVKVFRDNNQRNLAVGVILDFYTSDEFALEYNFNLSEISNISNMDYEKLINRFVNDIQTKINNFSQKIVVNNNLNRQYTYPKPVNSTYYRSIHEEKFEQKIKFPERKEVEFFAGVDNTKGIGNLPFNNFSLPGTKTAPTIMRKKQFGKVENIEIINEFLATSTKDKTLANEGLQVKINSSDADQKAQKLLAEPLKKDFLFLEQMQERGVKFYYLKEMSDSAPTLIFTEVDDEFPDLTTSTEKVLVRVDNYEEFYSSYFYVVGTGI